MSRRILVPAIAFAVLGASIFGVNYASANETTNPESTIVQKIADKFNLNKDEVQKVFDEQHATRQKKMQAKNDERLTKLVNDGKITEEQKTLILNKQKELQAKRQSSKGEFKNLTSDERKSQMEERKAELEKWAKDNGIDPEYLLPAFNGRGHGFGPKM